MKCLEQLDCSVLDDLDFIEALPVVHEPTYYAYPETFTTSETTCTLTVTYAEPETYNGEICYAQSPFGLSERDVQSIIKIFSQTRGNLEKSGRRKPGATGTKGGHANNWLRNSGIKPGYEECWGQADELMLNLRDAQQLGGFDDKWSIFIVKQPISPKIGPWPGSEHWWVEAWPVNPNDPRVILDLWKNKTDFDEDFWGVIDDDECQ